VLKCLRNIDILNDSQVSDDLLDNISYDLDYANYTENSKLFTIGGHCSSIKIIVNGMVDVYINNGINGNGHDVFVDTLYSGCNIGAYNIITKEDYNITGVASSDTTVLVLRYETLEKYIHKYRELRKIADDYETYILTEGLPYLDYKLYRSTVFKIKPLRKLQQGVRRIMRILQSYKLNQAASAAEHAIANAESNISLKEDERKPVDAQTVNLPDLVKKDSMNPSKIIKDDIDHYNKRRMSTRRANMRKISDRKVAEDGNAPSNCLEKDMKMDLLMAIINNQSHQIDKLTKFVKRVCVFNRL
jgi:CRP-like cAMP-binding protein